MTINVIVEKTNTGFSARVDNLQVYTTGSDIDEIRKNMVESINLYFDGTDVSVSEDDIIVKVE